LQLRFAATAGDKGAPVTGARPEDKQEAFESCQVATAKSGVLALSDYVWYARNDDADGGTTRSTVRLPAADDLPGWKL